MIIKSIKACGFLDIGPEKKQEFQKENVNFVNDSTIIKVLSVIFDSTYHSSYDLLEFTNNDYNGKHFIEVVLIQNDASLGKNYSWLKDKRLTLVRNLETPKLIHINGKSVKVDIFHEAITSLGFISIDGFHMHRLLKEEINRLSHFTGEDLWNLVLKVNTCEDLVRSIELKNKKKEIICQQMKKRMEIVEDVLPLKLQLRDDIRSQLTLTKKFNTLNSIASERKLRILLKEKQVNDNELENLKDNFNEKSFEAVNLTLQRVAANKNSLAERTMKNAIQKEQDWLLDEIEIYKLPVSNLGPTVLDLHKRIVTIEATSLACLKELEQNIKASNKFQKENLFNSKADLEILNWLLSFKLSVNENEMVMKKVQFKLILNELGENCKLKNKISYKTAKIDQLRADLMTTQHLNPQEMFNTTKYHFQQESEMKRSMMNLKAKTIELQRQIVQIDKKIFSAATLGGFDSSLIKTILSIETFISKVPDLFVDYLGPVFSHLKPHADIEYKIWPRLSSLANTFIFAKGSTARKTLREMQTSSIEVGSYTFLGIDEFVPSIQETLSEDMEDIVRSAETLVGDNSDDEVKNVIKLMLQDIRFMEKDENAFKNISIFNTCTLVTKNQEAVAVQSLLPNLFEAQGTTPIKELRKIYLNIKEFVVVEKKLLASHDLIEELEHQLKDHQTILPSGFDFSSFVTTLEMARLLKDKAESQKQSDLNEILFDAMKVLNEHLDEKIAEYNVDEFHEMKSIKTETFLRETNVSRKLELLVETKTNELKYSIERINVHSKLMRKLLANVLNPFEMFVDEETQKLKDELNEAFQTELEKYKAMLLELNQNNQSSSIITNEGELNVELIELRCRIYEKNSEKAVIDSAIKSCEESICSDESESLFDQRLYENFVNESAETLATELVKYQESLRQQKAECNIGKVTTEQYGHLVDTIKKVEKYSTSPTPTVKRNTLAFNAFPMKNRILVKVLKDTVYNYRSSFKVVMKDFIKKSSLYFYTRGVFDEIGFDSLNWESFDMERLKAMDFVVSWTEDGKNLIDPEALRKVKGFLLILHIINYISIFKFIVIDETFFKDLDETLVANLRKLLETVSPYVQIILHEAQNENDEIADEVEPMDISQ